MKNTTLVFRSLAVIIFITGIAHLASYASHANTADYKDTTNLILEEIPSKKEQHTSNSESQKEDINNIDDDFLIGDWKVIYNENEFKGAIVYIIKKEDNVYNAYTFQYQDENGNIQRAEKNKTLTIKKFDSQKGKGRYTISYENQYYQVDCKIDKIDHNTFHVSYDYYGYSATEIWKRQ